MPRTPPAPRAHGAHRRSRRSGSPLLLRVEQDLLTLLHEADADQVVAPSRPDRGRCAMARRFEYAISSVFFTCSPAASRRRRDVLLETRDRQEGRDLLVGSELQEVSRSPCRATPRAPGGISCTFRQWTRPSLVKKRIVRRRDEDVRDEVFPAGRRTDLFAAAARRARGTAGGDALDVAGGETVTTTSPRITGPIEMSSLFSMIVVCGGRRRSAPASPGARRR